MSAYMVSKSHLDVLVAIALQEGDRKAPEGAEKLGQWLQDCNWASIEARYPEEARGKGPAPYELQTRRWKIRGIDADYIVSAIKVLDCFEYQACEVRGWPHSDCHAWCADLRTSLCSNLPGWDEVQWGLDNLPLATVHNGPVPLDDLLAGDPKDGDTCYRS